MTEHDTLSAVLSALERIEVILLRLEDRIDLVVAEVEDPDPLERDQTQSLG